MQRLISNDRKLLIRIDPPKESFEATFTSVTDCDEFCGVLFKLRKNISIDSDAHRRIGDHRVVYELLMINSAGVRKKRNIILGKYKGTVDNHQ